VTLAALRGALGFLTRLPLGRDEDAWHAFRTRPYAIVFVGYVVGALVALPLLVPAPAPTVAVLYVLAVLTVTGINHLDGLADLGDAVVVHGGPEQRRAVMRDTTLGVGGTAAVLVALLALALAGLALAGLPAPVAVALALGAEVGAKLAMATLVCLGEPAHDGLGSQLTGAAPADLLPAAAVAVPAVLVWPEPAVAVSVLAGAAVAAALLPWANRRLGGASGDVFGAANELARVLALHAGVVAWTLF